MEIINVPTIEGNKKEKVYNVKDFPYGILKGDLPLVTRRGTGKKYYNISSAFDIETTTPEPPFNWKGNQKEYEYRPFGFMYHWQFCICNIVVFGRRWEEFQYFLKEVKKAMKLNDKKILVVYVHFLSFEFQHMKEFINIMNIFAKDKRKPIKVEGDGFEFRCSYFLSNMSLQKFCENSALCKHYKLDGENFDYNKLRTPDTPLTEYEKGYCYNDVRGLCECIDTRLQDDSIVTIPLTSTGYVRRVYRKAMTTKENRKQFVKTKLDSHLYSLLRGAFRGGNTHANRQISNVILENVYSFDIQSSYPTCIMMDEFPIGKFTKVTLDSQKKLDYYLSHYCVIMDVSFYNIKNNIDEVIPYIDIAHCIEKKKILNDNGRVLEAEYIRLKITEIDLEIIRDTYNYEGFTVNEAYYCKKGKLPKEMRATMLTFYDGKTQLKGIKGKEYEYAKSKNMLNATFGMCVTDIIHHIIEYDVESMQWSETVPFSEDAIADFFASRNNFLSYQWGVWITANARKRLQRMIKKVGFDLVYIDTDSIKFQNKKHIEEFEKLNEELKEQCENNDIRAYSDKEDADGNIKRYYLGTWDNDGNYDRFMTLGAKKYAYEYVKRSGDLELVDFHITVSGMGKEKGRKMICNLGHFKIGETYRNIGRTTSWFNDEKPHNITVDGCTFTTASNIGVLETSYTLGVTNEYWSLIFDNNNIKSLEIF